ncbi:amino acid permease [Phytomonospora endophytica]|uniref:APA family basic amino acid/polyamine antiporter n=1 Tax=Phytomonospora endophytica TaxID=714109 RepID=A0A841FM22_9ACTN|nr:amino acid permease [Phytomonospora endophytica]MBB6034582.1 APA family basic amino acid/polyamine antiporter [Phytomonospora endophytica]GIG71358.1 amino acid permease [Phytomonospora endophytica]
MTSQLWRTKNIEQSIADSEEPSHRLRRELGVWDVIVFGVAVVIGAGIFTLTASTAGDITGPAVSLSFVIAAIACGLAALCYAEFASTVPVAGSAYTFSYATFGEFVAWILGWDLILEFALAAAVVAKGWSSYLGETFSLFGTDVSTTSIGGFKVDWGAILVVAVLTVLLAVGTRLSSRVSQVITAIKVAVVLFVIILGIGYVSTTNYSPFIPPAAEPAAGHGGVNQSLLSSMFGDVGSTYGVFGMLAGASIVFFAFIGFDVVATTAEETKDPQRNLPRGIIGSLVIVTILYVATALVVTGMVPFSELQTGPDGSKATLATAFEAHGADWAATIISLGALAGLTTVVMVMMLGQSRVGFAMARDGLLPRSWSKTGEHGTPVRITIGVGVVVAVAAGFFPAGRLEEMVNVGTLFAFVLVSAGVLILRRTRPDLPRGFRTPWVPVVPVLAILACAWLMINLTVLTWIRFLVWMAAGVIIYFIYGKRHSVLGQRIP